MTLTEYTKALLEDGVKVTRIECSSDLLYKGQKSVGKGVKVASEPSHGVDACFFHGDVLVARCRGLQPDEPPE